MVEGNKALDEMLGRVNSGAIVTFSSPRAHQLNVTFLPVPRGNSLIVMKTQEDAEYAEKI